jgi:hypothetical protein
VEVVGWLGAAVAPMASTTSSTMPIRRAIVDPFCAAGSQPVRLDLDVPRLDKGVTAYTHRSGRRLRVGPVTNWPRDGHGVGPIGGFVPAATGRNGAAAPRWARFR